MTPAEKAKKYQLAQAAKEAREAKKRSIAETSTGPLTVTRTAQTPPCFASLVALRNLSPSPMND